MGNKQSIPDTVFELRLKKNELNRLSQKCAKEEKAEKMKVKRAIEQGNREGAHIYGQNAIRKKHESLQYMRMAAKMDAVASRLDGAARSMDVSDSISKTVPQLSKALKKMSVEEITTNMDEFEQMFEDLDVRTEYMGAAIDSTTATTTPADEVDQLIAQVGEEHQLDVQEMMSTSAPARHGMPKMVNPTQKDSLDDRLANLKDA